MLSKVVKMLLHLDSLIHIIANKKCTINEKQRVQLLNDKLKRSTIVKAEFTPPLDPKSCQADAGRTHQSKQQDAS